MRFIFQFPFLAELTKISLGGRFFSNIGKKNGGKIFSKISDATGRGVYPNLTATPLGICEGPTAAVGGTCAADAAEPSDSQGGGVNHSGVSAVGVRSGHPYRSRVLGKISE